MCDLVSVSASLPSSQASFPARLPALGLAVFQLYDSFDSSLTLFSDSLLRLHGQNLAQRRLDPLPLRIHDSDQQDFFIQSQNLQLWFSGTTGMLEVSLDLNNCHVSQLKILLSIVIFPA